MPTLFSSLFLLGASSLLWFIAWSKRSGGSGHVIAWAGLAFGFLVMGVDEVAQIHEGFVGRLVVHVVWQGDGVLHYVWYLPYLVLITILAGVYFPFLRDLSVRWRWCFLSCGIIYIGGAVGVEMREAVLTSGPTPQYVVLLNQAVEEGLEMLGVVLFIYALLRYISEHGYNLRLMVEGERDTQKTLHHMDRPKQAAQLEARERYSKRVYRTGRDARSVSASKQA